jgi:hypothetical protein
MTKELGSTRLHYATARQANEELMLMRVLVIELEVRHGESARTADQRSGRQRPETRTRAQDDGQQDERPLWK